MQGAAQVTPGVAWTTARVLVGSWVPSANRVRVSGSTLCVAPVASRYRTDWAWMPAHRPPSNRISISARPIPTTPAASRRGSASRLRRVSAHEPCHTSTADPRAGGASVWLGR